MKLGVLALQGDFSAHRQALVQAASALAEASEVVEVRRPHHLKGLDGIVMPGGESSALLRLMKPIGMGQALTEFAREGGWIFATCAGTILLAKRVSNPEQESLGLLDIEVERNGFGRQKESFIDSGEVSARFASAPDADSSPTADSGSDPNEVEMVFIRAPRIREVGPEVEVLGAWRGEPVLVRQGRVFGATFHPELTPGAPLHLGFLREMARSSASAQAGEDPATSPAPA